jgi:acetoin utilization deacetylase AcuC-like enzyme
MHDMVYYYPEGHQAHAEAGHPERPDRVEAIRSALEEAGWWATYPHLKPLDLGEEILTAIHAETFLSTLDRVCRRGEHFDMDTYTTPASWELALDTAGGAAATAATVWQRLGKRGFALTRPPGHHATRMSAMGFCLVNNVALAAEYLLQQEGARRLAVIDLDLHHGNGTQDIFYRRGEVFYISTHQAPLYPGTGWLEEIGAGAGERTTANVPLPPFSGDQAFLTVMDTVILPLLDRFRPEMLLVSYGFDPHWSDPLGHLLLSAQVYGELIGRLTRWADEYCLGRIALFLEGGYNLEAARTCSLAVTAALLGYPCPPLTGKAAGPSPESEGSAWEAVVKQARELWTLS